jgi:hypothetical protein
MRNACKKLVGKRDEKKPLGIDGKTILEYILQKQCGNLGAVDSTGSG